MPRLKFTKMHGAGNDFVMLNGITQTVQLSAAQWRYLGDRHFGVGADQMLLVESSDDPSIDFRYRIFNADGSEVEQCGNGSRCFVRFVRDQGLTTKATIRVQTVNGVIAPTMLADGRVRVDMGAPRFALDQIPFSGEGLVSEVQESATLWSLPLAGAQLVGSVVSMGNPHVVIVVADTEAAPVARWGPQVQALEFNGRRVFPEGVNVGFIQVVNRQQARLRVYERGAGETLACGTGACAALVAGVLRGLLDAQVEVLMHGGPLVLEWRASASAASANSVFLSGDAKVVFTGEIDIPALA
jgi:diaminopimelate epimerase